MKLVFGDGGATLLNTEYSTALQGVLSMAGYWGNVADQPGRQDRTGQDGSVGGIMRRWEGIIQCMQLIGIINQCNSPSPSALHHQTWELRARAAAAAEPD
jgi:hypothetical protein